MLSVVLWLTVNAAPSRPPIADDLVPLVRSVHPSFDPATREIGKDARGDMRTVDAAARYEVAGATLLLLTTSDWRGNWKATLSSLGPKESGYPVLSSVEDFCLTPGAVKRVSALPAVGGVSELLFRDEQFRFVSVLMRGGVLTIGALVGAKLTPLIRTVYPGFDPKTNRLGQYEGSRPLYVESAGTIDVPGATLLSLTASNCDSERGTLVSFAPGSSTIVARVEGPLSLPQHTELLGPGVTGLIFNRRDGQLLVLSRGTALAVDLDRPKTFYGDTYRGVSVDPELRFRKSRANGFLEVEELSHTTACEPCKTTISSSLYRYDGAHYVPSAQLADPLVMAATATSVLIDSGLAKDFFRAEKAVDGVRETAWAEGAKGAIGEALTLKLKAPTALKSISLLGGCGVHPALWQKNHRLKRVKVAINGAPATSVELKDVDTLQPLPLAFAGPVTSVTFEIAEVYPGTGYDDACISEVVLEER